VGCICVSAYWGLAFIAIGSTSALAKPVVYNWTGGYIGAHIGGVWGDVDVKDDIKDGVLPGPFGYSVDGVFGGGTAGYNLQFDVWASLSTAC